jgi:drug/metabolite transporter (DMT)-like permease
VIPPLEGMTGGLAATALLSAFLHAAWNAGVKLSADRAGAMAAQVVGSGIISAALLTVVPFPSLAALPWLLASATFSFLALLALLRGYAAGGGFGLVYPLSRAISPVLVLLLSGLLRGETTSALGMAGVSLVSGGIVLFALGEGRGNARAVAAAGLAGVASAAYVFCDSAGARLSPSVLGYGLVGSLLNASMFSLFQHLHNKLSIPRALRANWRMAVFGSSAAMASYMLILWVWSLAPVALGAALRDTSLVFAALIATRMGEPLTRLRLVAILCVSAGAVAIRFA